MSAAQKSQKTHVFRKKKRGENWLSMGISSNIQHMYQLSPVFWGKLMLQSPVLAGFLLLKLRMSRGFRAEFAAQLQDLRPSGEVHQGQRKVIY